MAGHGAVQLAAADAAARQRHRQQFLGMSSWDRHQRLVHDYVTYYGGRLPADAGARGPERTDLDILRDNYRFIRTEADDAAAGGAGSWEARLSRRYYSRLFREYAIADLSRHREGRVGLRWRTHGEVVAGRGQFSCGGKGCEERRGLASFEVPFGYDEAGDRKQALVKVRLCPEHAYQLNYRKNKEEERRREKEERRQRKGGTTAAEKEERQRRRHITTAEGAAGDGRKKRRRGDSVGGSSRDDQSSEQQIPPEETEAPAPSAAQPAGAAADEFEQFCAGLFP